MPPGFRLRLRPDDAQALDDAPLGLAWDFEIDACRLHAPVPQERRQRHHVLCRGVISLCEELAEVVGEDLGGGDLGASGQTLEHGPDGLSGNRLALPVQEDGAGGDADLFGVAEELCLEGAVDEDLPRLVLARHLSLAVSRRLHGDVGKLRDADAGSGDSLHHEPVTGTPRRRQQGVVVRGAEVPVLRGEGAGLGFQQLCPAVRPLDKFEKGVEGRQDGIDGAEGVALALQPLLVAARRLRIGVLRTEKSGVAPQVAQVLLHGVPAVLLADEVSAEAVHKRRSDELFHDVLLVFLTYFSPKIPAGTGK